MSDLFLLHVTVLRLPGKESKLSSAEPLNVFGCSFLFVALSCCRTSPENAVKVAIQIEDFVCFLLLAATITHHASIVPQTSYYLFVLIISITSLLGKL